MNILVPDSWLREYLKTDATPKQLKDCLSLCGPSIERINVVGKETVYDIEVTGNRPDAMSVLGIAREASVILPRFGIDAVLLFDPYKDADKKPVAKGPLTLDITTDENLNPRFTVVVFDHVTVKPSPAWMQKRLTLVGVRPLNNVIDITNYLMHLYGQPVHAFDYDKIEDHIMILRASKKGETVTTLDGKVHTLPGDDIVIEDGSGDLIDLCGIMGGNSSKISEETKRVVLFMQNYDPSHVRKTCMALSHRTEAASLFEKGVDTELVMPTFLKGIELLKEETDGKIASKIYDIYPRPYVSATVSVKREKVDRYIGEHLPHDVIEQTLTSLGFETKISDENISVRVPSFRRDVTIDVDIIEEIARLYGYHRVKTKLPDTEPPETYVNPLLVWEQKMKTRLRDWGYTETYTYSMLSESLMDTFGFDKARTYQITNPLSDEWVYMRPSLLPSLLSAVKQNLSFERDLMLFELSNIYLYKNHDLPHEQPTLLIAATGRNYPKLKGISEAVFSLFGIPYPEGKISESPYFDQEKSLALGAFGIVGEIEGTLLSDMGISVPVTVLELNFEKLVAEANPKKSYKKISKFPPSFEDLALQVTEKVRIGTLIETIKNLDPLIDDVTLLDSYKNTKTLHVTYQSMEKNLTSDDVRPIREKILAAAQKMGATLKEQKIIL